MAIAKARVELGLACVECGGEKSSLGARGQGLGATEEGDGKGKGKVENEGEGDDNG